MVGIGEFSGKMHDDLIDGMRWTVDRGHTDLERLAIMGDSYGEYASLTGATFAPDVFAAAIDVVGVSDLANFMRSQPGSVKPMLAPGASTTVVRRCSASAGVHNVENRAGTSGNGRGGHRPAAVSNDPLRRLRARSQGPGHVGADTRRPRTVGLNGLAGPDWSRRTEPVPV
ncbi:prolyl oligopeptidase family serine peptidase [Streptomyces violaceusniger]|uniref:prolyl oligopeptidase family serine peptidase n=1 Tax=Streptomyces violaceusniger TaxID=68280 RepID=UPI00342BB8FB